MWRGILLGTLCLIACHRSPAPPSEAPTPPAPAVAEPRAGNPEEEALCTRDEDCALTQLAPEGCCPQCAPRALSTAALARLQQACASVPEASCPMPTCPPPRAVPTAACAEGRCTVRFISRE